MIIASEEKNVKIEELIEKRPGKVSGRKEFVWVLKMYLEDAYCKVKQSKEIMEGCQIFLVKKSITKTSTA